MKWFRERSLHTFASSLLALLSVVVCAAFIRPLWHGTPVIFISGQGLERWIENVRADSDIEKSLYRMMQLPGGDFLFRRAPRETVPAISALLQSQKTAALYPLRALEEEQALDFSSAERDWKTWTDQAEDRAAAHSDLADFYERRLQAQAELAALQFAAESATDPHERLTSVEAQRSWKAFERELEVAKDYALPRSESARIYADWIKRYPQEPSLYARQFAFFIDGKDFSAASDLIGRYRTAFPTDTVFPVKAEADLAVRRGQTKDGLVLYDSHFEPLWPAELVKSYFRLVIESHNQRAFSDVVRARIAADPDDLKDTVRLFYLYQQQGQLDSAKAVLSHYREQKETRGAHWTAAELHTLEKLFEAVQDFPEAARYAYALAADHSETASEQTGVVALARILLTAPEQPLRVGAGNLALYQNIATMDRGPGYLNGILSLWLNTQGPGNEFATEDQLATPYFHRARAAELVAQIDRRFAAEPGRAQLHARLMDAYAAYAEDPAVIREGTAILVQFPQFPGRVRVAFGLADAYERTRQVEKEFALYQDMLKELAAQADGVPLGNGGPAYSKPVLAQQVVIPESVQSSATSEADTINDAEVQADAPAKPASNARSAEYAQVLDRYLARLVSLHRLPDALTLLRGELDRNPQDPGLYERLADFLQQNSLNAHQEEVYQQAIQQFQDAGWYSKLARFYLRQRRTSDYSLLMRKVTDIFSGTELETFLEQAPAPNRSLALEVNLYASQRFPHDLRFVDRLINEYRVNGNEAALEKLLWNHWSESPQLRNYLFELLSRNGQLAAQLDALRTQSPEIEKADWAALAQRNPASERFWLEACLWQSHFEQGVPAADSLATAYPADHALAEQASSLYRSLAYFEPRDTDKAVAIQKRLLDSEPGNLETLARIGDIYADRDRFTEASPFWIRMAEVHPGEDTGYLQSATVFWDYFDFNSAQAQLEKARTRLSQATLFGYQQGAIEESRGNLPAAVRAYTAGAVADDASAESRERLLALARKPALQSQVEEGTGGLLKQSAPSKSAIQIRAAILEAEQRKADLLRELNRAIEQTSSFDVLDAISDTAHTQNLSEIQEAALRRQIALTTDPVRTLQLRYQLVDFLKQRNPASASAEVEAIYRGHGNILGVVRSTIDYDWEHDRKPQAVAVLLQSASFAYPQLKERFQLEAARKLTDLGEFGKSRNILSSLLNQDPLDAGVEAATAENLARAGDQSGLETFYRAQLDTVRKSGLAAEDKQQRIAKLRRGVISAATLLGNFNDAIDQFIEIVNAFPDDGAIAQEASLYAVSHGARERLLGFYQKTIAGSPRDPRWSIVLARLATAAEDDALAIDAYGKALHLRPERQDLYLAQAALEERVHRLDDAIELYRKLYLLSYRDPKWMEKVAELCARQGRAADAVKALETGWIEGKPARAANSFAVAERLEKWGMLNEAQQYAAKGFDQAGSDLLVSEQNGAVIYARILARKRQIGAALVSLRTARQQATQVTLANVAQQIVKNGPVAVTSDEWRKEREEERRTQATSGFALALNSLSAAVAEFATPEEKASFAELLKQNSAAANAEEISAVYLPAARTAGLADLTASLTWQLALHNARSGNVDLSEWMRIQKQRVQMDAAAAQLEKNVASFASSTRNAVWRTVADAYHDAGDAAGELRATEHLYASTHMEGEPLERYYRLLLAQRPQQLIGLAAGEDRAAQYLVRNGSVAQALDGVAARAEKKPPVWKSAYTALSGLYLNEHRPETATAFTNALNSDATIGDRVAQRADRSRQLAGEVWFYYGSRYGEFLDGEKDPRSEDYLESELEHTPGSSAAYLRLADYSAANSRVDGALADYQHSLDLNRDQPIVLDKVALLRSNQNRPADAVAAWRDAVRLLAEEIDARHVPETFWADFARVLADVTAHKQFEAVREPVDTMLRTYIARNGDYRAGPLLEAGYRANSKSVDWLLAISAGAANQQAVLSSILPNRWSSQGDWIDKSQLSRIYARIVELAQRDAQANAASNEDSIDSVRQSYVEALIAEKNISAARSVLAQVSEARRNTTGWLPSVLAVADADGTLDTLLASWKKQSSSAPADSDLRNATASLSKKANHAVLRFVYERALERREFTAANFLGLAALHLDENDAPGAVALLRRLTLVSDNIYADADSAAQLLEDRKKPDEALQFLAPLADASPWVAGFRVRQAKAMLALNPHDARAYAMLTAVAGDPRAAYRDRITAALSLKGHDASVAGSEELKALSQAGCPVPESVSKPFFIEGRVVAAACSTVPKTKEHLLRDAIASAPDDARTRLKYIWAAFAASSDSRALVAAEPYLQQVYYSSLSDSGSIDQNGDASLSGGDEPPDQSPQPLTLAALRPTQAIRLVQLASDAYERRRDFADAARILSTELAINRNPADRKALVERRKRINLELTRAQENDARAPNVHSEIGQDHVVRPRLSSGVPFPSDLANSVPAEEQQ